MISNTIILLTLTTSEQNSSLMNSINPILKMLILLFLNHYWYFPIFSRETIPKLKTSGSFKTSRTTNRCSFKKNSSLLNKVKHFHNLIEITDYLSGTHIVVMNQSKSMIQQEEEKKDSILDSECIYNCK